MTVTEKRDNRLAANRKLATIELTLLLHGDAARLWPLPPGPDVCPSWCQHCRKGGEAVAEPAA